MTRTSTVVFIPHVLLVHSGMPLSDNGGKLALTGFKQCRPLYAHSHTSVNEHAKG